MEIRVTFDDQGKAQAAEQAVGRSADSFGDRELGWVVLSQQEADKAQRALEKAGFVVNVRGKV